MAGGAGVVLGDGAAGEGARARALHHGRHAKAVVDAFLVDWIEGGISNDETELAEPDVNYKFTNVLFYLAINH